MSTTRMDLVLPKTRLQIAEEYGISTRTLSRHLQKRKLSFPPGLIMPCDQIKIYETIGWPGIYHKAEGSVK